MCDFNDKGKIHKFNMKLILSYIPVKTYEEQQKYIKSINSIIDNYFTDLDQRFPEKNHDGCRRDSRQSESDRQASERHKSVL